MRRERAVNKQPGSTAIDWWTASWIAALNGRGAELRAARAAALEICQRADDHSGTNRQQDVVCHLHVLIPSWQRRQLPDKGASARSRLRYASSRSAVS